MSSHKISWTRRIFGKFANASKHAYSTLKNKTLKYVHGHPSWIKTNLPVIVNDPGSTYVNEKGKIIKIGKRITVLMDKLTPGGFENYRYFSPENLKPVSGGRRTRSRKFRQVGG